MARLLQRTTSAGLNKRVAAALALLLAASGCALSPKFIVPQYYRPSVVAVLPFDNQSNNLTGPVLLRKLFIEGLQRKGYGVQPAEETDEKLKAAGITDAGQLPTIIPKELGEKLGVDAVFYGNVMKFNYITLGFYSNRIVQADFRLVSVSGEPLWEDERTVSNKDFAFSEDEIKENLKNQLIEKAVENILRSPLLEESRSVVRQSLITLP
jgi:hypothetical protein